MNIYFTLLILVVSYYEKANAGQFSYHSFLEAQFLNISEEVKLAPEKPESVHVREVP
jgi:hypothetical protein